MRTSNKHPTKQAGNVRRDISANKRLKIILAATGYEQLLLVGEATGRPITFSGVCHDPALRAVC